MCVERIFEQVCVRELLMGAGKVVNRCAGMVLRCGGRAICRHRDTNVFTVH